VENSPMLTSRGLGTVLGDLAAMGFDARWGVLGAADVGAPHQRDRIWIVGKATYAASHRPQEQTNKCVMESQGRDELQPSQPRNTNEVAHADISGRQAQRLCTIRPRKSGQIVVCGGEVSNAKSAGQPPRQDETPKRIGRPLEEQFRGSGIGASEWWQSEPDVGRVANGVAARVDRLKSIGNGQVPLCAATAWKLLTGEMK